MLHQGRPPSLLGLVAHSHCPKDSNAHACDYLQAPEHEKQHENEQPSGDDEQPGKDRHQHDLGEVIRAVTEACLPERGPTYAGPHEPAPKQWNMQVVQRAPEDAVGVLI